MNSRILKTVLFLIVAIVSFFLIPRLSGLDGASGYYSYLQSLLEDKFTSAMALFAASKLAAGVIVFFQNIQIDMGVVVAGLQVSPLMVLEPFGSTLNWLSNLFLISMGAIYAMKIILIISGWLFIKFIIPICSLVVIGSLWLKSMKSWINVTIKIFIISLIFFAIIPLTLHTSVLLDRLFLADAYNQAVQSVQVNTSEIQGIQGTIEDNVGNSKSFFNKLKDSITDINFKSLFSSLKTKAEDITKNLLNAFIILLITTVVLPLGALKLLWLLSKKLLTGVDSLWNRGTK